MAQRHRSVTRFYATLLATIGVVQAGRRGRYDRRARRFDRRRLRRCRPASRRRPATAPIGARFWINLRAGHGAGCARQRRACLLPRARRSGCVDAFHAAALAAGGVMRWRAAACGRIATATATTPPSSAIPDGNRIEAVTFAPSSVRATADPRPPAAFPWRLRGTAAPPSAASAGCPRPCRRPAVRNPVRRG